MDNDNGRAMPAPTSNGTISPHQIKIIHILKAQRGLDDEDYRALLHNLYGVDSCKKLTYMQAQDVIAHLGGTHWKPKRTGKLTDKQQYAIKKIWHRVTRAEDEKSEAKALNTFVARITGISMVEWLTQKAASKVIVALKEMEKSAK